jgi:hypothetical protein
MKITKLKWTVLAITGLTVFIPQSYALKSDVMNPHYQSTAEYRKTKVLCAKINNQIEALHRRINVLMDAKNRRAKPEELLAMGKSIRNSVEEIFEEINGHLSDRKIFKEDSRYLLGQLEAVLRSLENVSISSL